MKRVHKYAVPVDDHIVISMPAGAVIVSFDAQHGRLCVWALIDPAQPEETRTFRLAGTGHPISEAVAPIGSAMLIGGTLVYHLFEVTAGASQ